MNLPDSQMTVELYGASYFKAENNEEYVSLFLGQQVQDEKAENAKGITIMKMPADAGVYESLNFKAYPVVVDLSFRLKKAAGGKLGQVATKVSVRPSFGGNASSSSSASASKA